MALLASCARQASGEGRPSSGGAPSANSLASTSASAPPAPLPAVTPKATSWRESARLERWAETASAIDSTSSKERQSPDARYVRARAAEELGDCKTVVKVLDGLEKQLPLFELEVRQLRATCQAEVGPHADAIAYYSGRVATSSRLKLAQAQRGSGDLKAALQTLSQALKRLETLRKKRKRKSDLREIHDFEINVRQARAEILEKLELKRRAALDWRWLATQAVHRDVGYTAVSHIQRLDPSLALRAGEHFQRVEALANLGKIERVEEELKRVTEARGPKPSAGQVLHVRGWVHYRARRDYEQAAQLLEKAAAQGSRDPVSDRFYAARALSRAHRDEDAGKRYAEIARSYAGSYWGEQAKFLQARLHYIGGRWKQAIEGYDGYLSRYGAKARFGEAAHYELSVARLAAGQNGPAAAALAALAKAEKHSRHKARYLQLEGVAHLSGGHKKLAVRRFTEVMELRPLSLAALASRTRLQALGEAVPPLITPAAHKSQTSPLTVALPPKVLALQSMGLDRDAEQALQAHEKSIKEKYGERGEEALCRAYGQLTIAAQRYRIGQRAARWSQLDTEPSATTRWLWECIYPRPYPRAVSSAEEEWKLPKHLIYSLMRQESGFRPTVVSPARAVGLMQLIPPTARSVAEELKIPYDPALLRSPPHNIRMGAYYLGKVLETFGGNIALAAASYNAGPTAVSRWMEGGEALPLDIFVARIPYEETRNYVYRVLGNLARYAYLEGGAEAVPVLSLELPRGKRAGKDAY